MSSPLTSGLDNRKVYRFALYGRRNSGKTCILAALAMPRIANSSGLSCTWIDTLPKNRNPTDPHIMGAFTDGKAWLEQAIHNLEQGTVPPANPNEKEPFRFRYEFTSQDHRTFLVELIDYSGELIDPDLSEKDLARQLRKHLLELDGILVLAEVPRTNQHMSELYEELQRLQRAFASLRGEKQDGPALTAPVALLINKWDRRSGADEITAENRQSAVEEFLASDPQPPHRGLANTLRSSVTEGLFEVFPISAFGRHADNTVQDPAAGDGTEQAEPERPAQVYPLLSFGMEDGFVWACQSRDRIDLAEFESRTRKLAWWKLWQFARWKSGNVLDTQSASLGKRFPTTSAEADRVRQANHRKGIARIGRVGFLAVAVFAVYLGVGAYLDDRNYRRYKPLFANLGAVTETTELKKAEQWLTSYSSRSRFLTGYRLSYGSKQALTQLNEVHVRIGEIERQNNEEKNRILKNDDLVADLEQRVAGKNGMTELKSILAIFDNGLPHPEAASIETTQKYNALIRSVRSDLDNAIRTADGLSFEKKYHDLMRNNSLRVAAEHLASAQVGTVESEVLARLKADYASKCLPKLKAWISQLMKEQQWGRSRDDVQVLLEDKHTKTLLTDDQLRKIDDIRIEINDAEDKALYEQVARTKSQNAIDKYKMESPVKSMKKHVDAYDQYLKSNAGEVELKIDIKVSWGAECWDNHKNTVTIQLAGIEPLVANDVISKPGSSTSIGNIQIKRKLSDTIHMNASILITNGTFRFAERRNHGVGSFEGTVRDLTSGKTFNLDRYGNKITLHIGKDSLPQEPSLPEWHR